MNLIIRPATLNDAEACLMIYAPHILYSATSFEYEVPTVEEFQQRMDTIMQRHVWLVATVDEQVAGYAYGSKHRDRAAYQWSTEVSVYLSEKHQRLGLATKLYRSLFEKLSSKGYVNAYAGITIPNEPSIKFHEKMGFKPIGTYEGVGYKFDQWHDVHWMGKKL